MGQCRDLLRGQGDAHRQVELVLAGDGVVHQVLEHRFVGSLAVDEALTSTGDHGLLHQALFKQAVAQALGASVGVVAELLQQVIRTLEFFQVGEYRIGFDQVFVWVGAHAGVRQTLYTWHVKGNIAPIRR